MTARRPAQIISVMTTWTLRLVVVMCIVFFMAVFMTAILGGQGDVQRQSLEAVLAQVTGRTAMVNHLNDYRIFPDYVVDAEQIVLGASDAPEPDAMIGRLSLRQDTLARMMGNPPIEEFSFDHVITRPGLIGPFSLHLTEARVHKDVAVLKVLGQYGGHPLTVDLPLIVKGNKVQIDGTAMLDLTIGSVRISARPIITRQAVLFDPITITFEDVVVKGVLAVPMGEGAGGPPLLDLIDPAGIKTSWRIDQWDQGFHLVRLDGPGAVPPAIKNLGREAQRLIQKAQRVDSQGRTLPRVKVVVE